MIAAEEVANGRFFGSFLGGAMLLALVVPLLRTGGTRDIMGIQKYSMRCGSLRPIDLWACLRPIALGPIALWPTALWNEGKAN